MTKEIFSLILFCCCGFFYVWCYLYLFLRGSSCFGVRDVVQCCQNGKMSLDFAKLDRRLTLPYTGPLE